MSGSWRVDRAQCKMTDCQWIEVVGYVKMVCGMLTDKPHPNRIDRSSREGIQRHPHPRSLHHSGQSHLPARGHARWHAPAGSHGRLHFQAFRARSRTEHGQDGKPGPHGRAACADPLRHPDLGETVQLEHDPEGDCKFGCVCVARSDKHPFCRLWMKGKRDKMQ